MSHICLCQFRQHAPGVCVSICPYVYVPYMSLCICLIYAHMCPCICPIYVLIYMSHICLCQSRQHAPGVCVSICPYVYVSYMSLCICLIYAHICPYVYVPYMSLFICPNMPLSISATRSRCLCVYMPIYVPMCMSHICPIYLECAPLVWSITHSLTDCGICPYMSLYVPTCPYMCSLETHSLTVAYAPLRPYMSLYVPICPYMCGH